MDIFYDRNTWDPRWIDLTKLAATWSKDRSTKLGAVIVDKNEVVLSIGWNGFPRGVDDNVDSRHKRPEKYLWTVHAERNAFYNAARKGVSLEGARLYVPWFPCSGCTQGIIQCGISEVVTTPPDFAHPRWGEDWEIAAPMLDEAGVIVRYFHESKKDKVQ